VGDPEPITVDNYLCSYASANTNILRVDSTGLLTGIRPGTTSVTARYGSVSNAIAITVFPEPVVLAHRYSFNETSGTDVADSIGGPAWTGTLPNGGTFTNGQLSMLGASQQYVNIPTNIFSGMTNVTFDVWTTFPTNLPWNTWFFGFGDIISGAGAWYFFVQPQSGSFCMGGGNPGWQFDGERASAAMDWSGQTLHITCVASTGGGYLALYTNGVLAATYNSLTYPITSIHDNFSYINQSLYSSDPHVDLTINELRIYSGALSPAQVVLNDELGPDVLAAPSAPILSVAIVGGNVVVSWPTNSSGFTLASKGSLTGGSWNPVGTSPVISGANYQVTLPPTNTAQFFRLSK
jgi:hypothetical protein